MFNKIIQDINKITNFLMYIIYGLDLVRILIYLFKNFIGVLLCVYGKFNKSKE